MQSCPCSILDVREEQILEANGLLSIRLICNVCGYTIDSRVIEEARPAERERHFQDDRGLSFGASAS